MSLMWAERHLKSTLQLIFGNSVKLAGVVAKIMKISVNTL